MSDTITEDQVQADMKELATLQAKADTIKVRLGSYLNPGQSHSSPYATLNLSKGGEIFTRNTKGNEQYELWKNQAVKKFWGKYSSSKPALKLTLTEQGKALAKKVQVLPLEIKEKQVVK